MRKSTVNSTTVQTIQGAGATPFTLSALGWAASMPPFGADLTASCCSAQISPSGEAAGYEENEFMASFGERTCEACGGLDGHHFKIADIQYGTNYLPMHPFCRSTTIADFGEDTLKGLERRAKDENGNTVKVPASQSYEEWYKQNVSEK